MQKSPPTKKLFNPQDRYFHNESGWWFYTAEMLSGPYQAKSDCVDACRYYIQKRDGVLSYMATRR